MGGTAWRWIGWFAVDASGDGSRRWLDVCVGGDVLTARNGSPYRLLRLEDSTPGATTSEVHAAFPRGGRMAARIVIEVPEAGLVARCEVVVPVNRGLEPDASRIRLAAIELARTRPEAPSDPHGWWAERSGIAPGSYASAA